MVKERKGIKKKKMLLSDWGTAIKIKSLKKYRGFLNFQWEIEIIKYDTMKRKQESNMLNSEAELKYQGKKKHKKTLKVVTLE